MNIVFLTPTMLLILQETHFSTARFSRSDFLMLYMCNDLKRKYHTAPAQDNCVLMQSLSQRVSCSLGLPPVDSEAQLR